VHTGVDHVRNALRGFPQVKATNAYAAKRALLAYLATIAPFIGTNKVQLMYARNDRDMEKLCVFGGGARFVQTEEAAEGVIRFETVTTGLYVRAHDTDAQAAETSVEAIADAIAAALIDHPDLTDALSFEQIAGGSADFYQHDDGVEAILSLSCQIESHLS
jgi:hypothetical protein